MTGSGWYSFAILGAGSAVAAGCFAIKQDAAGRRTSNATRPSEIINGRKYSVYRLTHPVLREMRTGRLGVQLRRRRATNPNAVADETSPPPQWVRVQFFRETDGDPGRTEWRRSSTFEIVGTATVDYLSRSPGWFPSKRLMHYSVDLTNVRSVKQPYGRRSPRH